MNEASERLRESLLGHEGEMLRVYDDATGKTLNRGDTVRGYATIGVGRNLMGKGISRIESEYLLGNDIVEVERDLDRLLPQWRNWVPARRVAVMELAFNMGASNFVSGWPNTVAKMRSSEWRMVGDALLASKWRKQVGDTRALKIINLFVTGSFK